MPPLCVSPAVPPGRATVQAAAAHLPAPHLAVPPPQLSVTCDVNTTALQRALYFVCNDEFVQGLIEGMLNGFDVGYKGVLHSSVPPNHSSAVSNPGVVSEYIATEITRGHTMGPYPCPPFPDFICSPIGCIPKKNGKWRLILDLSAPTGSSVNDGISREEFSMQYIRFDDIIRMITKHGRGALIAKVDLEHAFRQCPVRKQDWPLLCYAWEGQFYFDVRLPFGLRSSPALFNRLAEALECICRHRGATDTVHYLDDFVTCGSPEARTCDDNKRLILEVCHELGVKVSPEKVEGPSSCLTVLGIEVDTMSWEMRLPREKCQEYLDRLEEWSTRPQCTRRQLDSVLGCLFFASRMVRQGRTFLRRLVDARATSPSSGHFALPTGAASDLSWWRHFLRA